MVELKCQESGNTKWQERKRPIPDLQKPNGSIKVHPQREQQKIPTDTTHTVLKSLETQQLMLREPSGVLTPSMVRDHSHGEVDLLWVQVWRGADGVVARLQQGQLGEQQSGGHLNGGELLQHLHQRRIIEPLPLLVLLQALGGDEKKTRWDKYRG